ncbi:MAG: Ig-like domain-containing protein [Firmicutes bacterium]|nr:Ig-like domain-containing protein [Bacillota bacterium]
MKKKVGFIAVLLVLLTASVGLFACTDPADTTVTVTGVTLNKTTLTLTVGGDETLTAAVLPADASQQVTWSVSEGGAFVEVAAGKVTAKAAGTAKVRATSVADTAKWAECTVTVNPVPDPQPEQFTVTVTNGTVRAANAAPETAAPSGEFEENTSVIVLADAPPVDGDLFDKWTAGTAAGGADISSANPYTFTVTADTALYANYRTPTENYTVTVVNGTVDTDEPDTTEYTALEGTLITVNADLGLNQALVKWTYDDADGETASIDNPYEFILDGDVTLYAHVADTYLVTVVDGYLINGTQTDSARFIEGQSVTVYPQIPQNQLFTHWIITGDATEYNENNPDGYTFVLSDTDVEITAHFRALYSFTLSVTDGTFSAGDIENEISYTFTEGSDGWENYQELSVTITADNKGATAEFTNWTNDDGDTEFAVTPERTFILTQDLSLTANFVYSYTVTVTGGTASEETAAENQMVYLTVGTPPQGEKFVEWTVIQGGVTVEWDIAEEKFYFVMGTQNVEIEAVFEVITYTVTVTDGKGTASHATAAPGTEITLTPPVSPDDYDNTVHGFTGWTVSGGVTITDNKFLMPEANVTVTAQFIELFQQIDRPVNGAAADAMSGTSGIMFREGPTADATAFNRVAGAPSLFIPNITKEIRLHIYTDSTVDTDIVPSLGYLVVTFHALNAETGQIINTMNSGRIATSDGTVFIAVNGGSTNLFFMEFSKLMDMLRHELGLAYNATQSYYFAAQIIAVENPVSVTVNGYTHSVTYQDSPISVSGAPVNPFVREAGDPKGEFTVEVRNGFINGDLTQITANYGVLLKLTAESPDPDFDFGGWYEVEADGTHIAFLSALETLDYIVSDDIILEAVFSQDVQKQAIATPANDANQMFRKTSATIWEFDRQRGPGNELISAFVEVEGASHLMFLIYADEADYPSNPAGTFNFFAARANNSGWFESMDGLRTANIQGNFANYYVNQAHELIAIHRLIAYSVGETYSESTLYRFAAQVIADPAHPLYTDSAVTELGTHEFNKNDGPEQGPYTVTIVDADGDTLETILANHNAFVHLTAPAADPGYIFTGWWEVTDISGSDITKGNRLSANLTFSFEAVRNITVIAEFIDENDVAQEKLQTPDNSGNNFIQWNSAENNGDAWFFNPDTVFNSNIAYVQYFIYTSQTADKDTDFVATFKITENKGQFPSTVAGGAAGTQTVRAFFSTMDNATQTIFRMDGNRLQVNGWIGQNLGDLGNYPNARGIIRGLIPGYNSNNDYFFAVRLVSANLTLFNDSDISAIGDARRLG